MSKGLYITTPIRKTNASSLIKVDVGVIADNFTEVVNELEVGVNTIGKGKFVQSIKSFTLSGCLRLNAGTIGVFLETPVYAEPDQEIILLVNGKFIIKFLNEDGKLKTMRDLVSVLGDKSPVALLEEAIGCSPKTITSEAYHLSSERHPELTEDDVDGLSCVGEDLLHLFE